MNSPINIVSLIEKDANTRLSSSYQNELLNKIKNTFSDNQQQLFVSSFYCYLNYHSKTDFVVDFTHVWKWCGFTRKDSAKKLLEKFFVENVDYKTEVFAPPTGGAKTEAKINEKAAPEISGAKNDPRGGQNKERILLNISTFKKFCLKAGTKKADEIHDYYIKLEELLQETLKEQTDELQNQLQQNQKQLQQNQELLDEKEEKMTQQQEQIVELEKRANFRQKRIQYPNNNYVYLLSSKAHEQTRSYVIGKAYNLENRLTNYNKTFEHEVVYKRQCKNFSQLKVVESMILYKLFAWKERLTRDRYILPENKDITFFTNVFDEAVSWFESVDEDLEIFKDEQTEKEEHTDANRQYKDTDDNRKKDQEYHKQYEIDNKEKRKDQHAIWYQENKEEYLEKCKEWKAENVEKCKEYNKKYEETHKETRKEQKKKFRQENPEIMKARAAKYEQENKTKIAEYKAKSYQEKKLRKFICPCGSEITEASKSSHKKTLKHKEYEQRKE